MIEGVGKYIGGKVISAILVVASVLVIVWYLRLEPSARALLWTTVRSALVWIGFVGILPWALFFVPPMVVKAESNAVSAIALLGYLGVDVGVAMMLTSWQWGSGWQTALLCVGFLAAGVYNFWVCDYLAQRAEDVV